MATNIFIKDHGFGVNFDNWSRVRSVVYNYYDGIKDDPLDGMAWTGSSETLLDSSNFNLIQKVAPKLILNDSLIGSTDFEYVIIPGLYEGSYGIYALTNNKTILQLIGYVNINLNYNYNTNSYESNGGTINIYETPVENYTPTPNWVETITVNEMPYTYFEHGDNFQEVWRNAQTGKEVHTFGSRNPETGYSAKELGENGVTSWDIQSVTYYPGIYPPVE